MAPRAERDAFGRILGAAFPQPDQVMHLDRRLRRFEGPEEVTIRHACWRGDQVLLFKVG